jgi:hypothetical protein
MRIKMRINTKTLKAFSACRSGLDNFIKHYPDFDGAFEEVLSLDNIPYDDKIWLGQKVLNRNQLIQFAILCADSVFNIYESKYPKETGIKKCLEYMKTIVDFDNLTATQRKKLIAFKNCAYKARIGAYDAAAAYAAGTAYAAGAAYAEDAAAYAAGTAYAADAAYAEDAAAYAANAASTTASIYNAGLKKEQQNLNLEFLKMVSTL